MQSVWANNNYRRCRRHQWLRNAAVKAEIKGLIIAAQDQSLATRSYRHLIIKDGTDPNTEYAENTKKPSTICDPASQNQQKVAWPSFLLWLEIGDQGQHG